MVLPFRCRLTFITEAWQRVKLYPHGALAPLLLLSLPVPREGLCPGNPVSQQHDKEGRMTNSTKQIAAMTFAGLLAAMAPAFASTATGSHTGTPHKGTRSTENTPSSTGTTKAL